MVMANKKKDHQFSNNSTGQKNVKTEEPYRFIKRQHYE